MGFDRIEAKLAAKESLRTNKPSPILVTLVYLLLVGGISALINLFISNPVSDAIESYYRWGYELDEIWDYVLRQSSGALTVYSIVAFLLSLYRTVMGYGYTSYALRLARNENPGYTHLFDGFARFFRVLWANILTGIFEFLWTLLYSIPAIVFFIIFVVVAGDDSLEAVLGIYWLLVVYLMVVAVVISLRYRLTYYFLIDEPDCTAREAIGKSCQAMKGWKMELFVLDLSFFGWVLLSAITLGIVGLWVIPYRGATDANFYDAVVPRPSDPREGYTGSIYNTSPDDTAAPF